MRSVITRCVLQTMSGKLSDGRYDEFERVLGASRDGKNTGVEVEHQQRRPYPVCRHTERSWCRRTTAGWTQALLPI